MLCLKKLLAILMCCLCAESSIASVLLKNGVQLEQSSEAQILRDISAKKTLDQVRRSDSWRQISSARDTYPGFDQSAFWLRAPLKNTAEKELWVLAIQSTGWEEIDWHIVRADGRIETSLAGTSREGKPGALPGPKPNVVLDLLPDEEVHLYLRCRSIARAALSVQVSQINDFKDDKSFYMYVLSFGALAVLCIMGLVIAFYSKQKGGIAYSTSTVAMAMYQVGLSNFGQMLDLPFHHFLSTKGINFFGMLSMLLALIYLRVFFDLGGKKRWPDIAWWILLILNGLTLPLSLITPFYPFIIWINIYSMIFGFLSFSFAVWAWRQGMLFARLYVFSWPFVWFALLFDFFARLGIVPGKEVQGHIVLFCLVIFQLGIFLTMAERIRTKNKEYKDAQIHMLEAERGLNDRLESEVSSRTASLEIATQEAIKANRFKDLFLANMSHEIRTPLSALIGLSQIMVRRGQERGLPEDFRRLLDQIHSGGSHLNLMLTNLMDVGAASHGRVPLQISPVNLKDWQISVRNILEPLAIARDLPTIQWQLDFDDDLVFWSDPVRLSQVIINLVHNALKFSSQNGEVLIKLSYAADILTLDVLDSGCGLPENSDELFEKFERNEATVSDSEHGAGLGLYIVKTSLDLLGGCITASNRESGGAAFHVTIPQAKQAPLTNPPHPAPH